MFLKSLIEFLSCIVESHSLLPFYSATMEIQMLLRWREKTLYLLLCPKIISSALNYLYLVQQKLESEVKSQPEENQMELY